MHVDFPFRFDNHNRTAQSGASEYLRDLIYQVLFTNPGERVNRPMFGSGLRQLLFAPNSDELTATTQAMVQGALQQWLGDLILVEAVNVDNEDETIRIAIQYIVRRTGEREIAEFSGGQLI